MSRNTQNKVALKKGKAGYKQTKLGWIPEDWSTPTIDEAFEFLRTSSFSRNQLNYDNENETYYIHYGDIHATYKTPILDFKKIKSVPKLNKDVQLPATVQYLKNGDVIIADASEDYEGVGTAIELQNLNGKKVISGLHTFALRDKAELTIEGFRTYIFKNPVVKKALKTIATGSKVYGISKGNIQKFKIVLPPLPEQQKIANILNTWDKAIAAQEKLITQKQALKKGLMQQLLTGKKRFAGFEGEWEEVKIKDLFEMSAARDMLTEHFNNVRTEKHKFPVYSNALTNKGLYGYYDFFQYESNKITVTARGSLGCAIPRFDKFNGIGRLLILAPKIELDLKYVSEYINNAIRIFVESTGVPQLTSPQFSNYKLKIPKVSEQRRISKVLASIDIEIDCLKNEKRMYTKQKQGLMQQLLTGETRVKI